MISAALRWLGRVPATDPYERRTAIAAQVFCIGLSILLVVTEVVREWGRPGVADAPTLFGVLADMLSVAVSLGAVALIRRGRIRAGYALVIASYVAILCTSLVARGLDYHRFFLLRVFAVVLVLPALLLGRRALWSTLGVLLAAMGVGHLRDLGRLGGAGPMQAPEPPLGAWVQAVAVMVLFAVVLDRFGAALAEAYATAIGRQREAERVSRELTLAKEVLETEMTRRMATESLLIQSQKLEAIGRLSGGVAHDFNNLLTAILGFAQLSRDACPPGDPRREYLDGVVQAAHRGAGLTRQLLAFARRQIVEPRPVRVDERVRAVEPMLRRLIGESVRIEMSLSADPIAVMIDPLQFDQVIVNLAVNARDAMPRGGTLRFETGPVDVAAGDGPAATELLPGRHVRLRVHDSGEGMDEVTLASAFEPFFTTKDVGKGTGLGLATCHGIVRQAGGTITVTSTPGHGTTFEILLPATLAPPEPERLPVRRSAAGGPGVILVVEDDTLLRNLVARVLADHGHHVLTAADPAAAEDLVRGHSGHLDLVLTDVVLPGVDGRRLAETLATIHPGLSTLYMSGYSDDVIARHGALEPGIELLQKPFTPDDLLDRVRAVLDARGDSA